MSEHDDKQWESLVSDWQSQPYAHIDLDALLARSKRRTFVAKLFLFMNVIATVGLYASFFLGLYEGDWEMPLMVYIAFGAVLSTVYVYYEFTIRNATWKLAESGPEQALIRAISGVEGAIKYCKLMKYSSIALLPAANWFIYEMGKSSDKEQWVVYAWGNGVVLMMYALAEYYQRKRQHEKNQLEQQLNA